MTNSEAIETLRANYPDSCYGLLRDAVDTAIYALSAQPDLQPTCNKLATDCISRKAALDELGDDPEVWTDKDEYAQGLNNQWHYDRNAILRCPSAQSEQTKMIKEIRKWINSGNRGSADYFIVDKIEEIINKYE